MLNADLARKELKPDSKPAISIDRLLTTVDRAAELCSELLAYSGKGKFTIEPFAAEKLVTEMRNLFEISTPKGLEIEYETDSSNPLIKGDITQIRQVVMNFITNAGEAIGSSNGKITLSVSTRFCDEKYLESRDFVEEVAPGEFACISVEDNGCGMEPAIIKRMFDPFFSTKESGHGLGLSAALGIIRGHNGTISVESVVDKGTKITMLLPLSDEASVIVPATPDPEPANSSKGIILFADDEADIRSLAEAVLADCGYTVLQARDGNEALEIFKNRHEELQLVILDLIMPNKTGLECYLEIAELDASVPVVFSSGFNEGDALKDLPKSTQSAFLKKPYLAEDLRKFVEGFVR
jgi:CheY-like chemotaxis protein